MITTKERQPGRDNDEEGPRRMFEEACRERGVSILRVNRSNKISISYLGCINAVIIYDNATDLHIEKIMGIISHIIPTLVLDSARTC